MEKTINTMVENMKKSIINDLSDRDSIKCHKVMNLLLDAYNDFQQSERDGVDYIFNIHNADDVICCMEGGMTTKEVAKLYNESQVNTLPYFYFGCNYPTAKPINTWSEMRLNLIMWLDDMLPYILAYPFVHDSYKEIYLRYVTNVILAENDSYDALAELKCMLKGDEC